MNPQGGQGVVLVTFNDRVGRLGFFAHPALRRDNPGEPRVNGGHHDMIAALRLVRQNIAAFGGGEPATPPSTPARQRAAATAFGRQQGCARQSAGLPKG